MLVAFDKDQHVHDAQMRAIAVLSKRPQAALSTKRGRAVLSEGLSCSFSEDGHSVDIDMPKELGGTDAAPSPGFFGRAAICGCLAIGIKMTAARDGIRVDAVQVDITQDWDGRGVLGMPGANPVADATVLHVALRSGEHRSTLDRLVSKALKSDPWFLAFRDAQSLELRVTASEGET